MTTLDKAEAAGRARTCAGRSDPRGDLAGCICRNIGYRDSRANFRERSYRFPFHAESRAGGP